MQRRNLNTAYIQNRTGALLYCDRPYRYATLIKGAILSFHKLDTIATVGGYVALFLMSYNIMHILRPITGTFLQFAIYSAFWIVVFAAALEYLRMLFVMSNYTEGEPDEIELTEAEKDELEDKLNEIINRRN